MSVEAKVAARLSGVAGGQVYPLFAPMGTAPPYVIYSNVGGAQRHAMDGPLSGRTNRIRLMAYATTYAEADSTLGDVQTAMAPDGADLLTSLITRHDAYHDPDVDVFRVGADYSVYER